jgi:hypothetical protein
MGAAQHLVLTSGLAPAGGREGGSREATGFSAAPWPLGEVGGSSVAAQMVVA